MGYDRHDMTQFRRSSLHLRKEYTRLLLLRYYLGASRSD